MIEMLVTLLILMVGLLGVAGLMAKAQQAEMESYQRVQALVLLRDMAARINANRQVASCYAITTDTATGTPYLGVGSAAPAACATGTDVTAQAQADADLAAWSDALAGAGESSAGGTNVGAMVGGRGCISYDAADQTYLISVVWQGLGATTPPPASLSCAKTPATLYGNEARRRVVSLTLRMATLL